MKKAYLCILIAAVSILVTSCRNDDGNDSFIPARERSIEAPAATEIVESYLETHFYNYEEFANPPADFDFKIVFDTIAGDNSTKTPLINQVDSKIVTDRLDQTVTYKLYYLKVAQGGGENSPTFGDVASLQYDGIWINEEVPQLAYSQRFDSSTVPIVFNLPSIVNGLQDALQEFNDAAEVVTGSDGTITATDPGIGAVFMQSGLGYYVNENGQGGDIPVYAQLIFTFNIFTVTEGDQDNDGILTIDEDLNGNLLEEDDDTDGDGLPNYFDGDDDNDGRPTSEEIVVDGDGNITFPDSDGDGVVDYLDSDS